MKKVISIALVLVLALSVFAMVGCGKDKEPVETPTENVAETLKFGMGVVASYGDKTDADGDTNGACEVNTTAVAVLLDKDSKIVDIDLDSVVASASWTSEGKAIAGEEIKTKYELGSDYGMTAAINYGPQNDPNGDGKVLEWNDQADIFKATAVGKTLAEVKAFVAENGSTTGGLATAGCTINVSEFMAALEKAVANAVDSKATADNKLSLAIASSVENTDATEDANGKAAVSSTAVATVIGADAKVVVAKTDSIAVEIDFDAKGISSTDVAAEIKTKGELGADYGMTAAINYGPQNDPNGDGKVLEWNEQAAAFDAALVGKTASDFAALAGEDGRGTGDLATAGCTIAIGEMIKAAEKAAK